jgi:hypothetical protein
MHTGWISRDDGQRFPLDPLQRRAELIEHYDRHGYPERAAYLRRIDEGPRILASLQAAANDPSSLLDATFVAIEWWAGDDLGRFAITDFMVSGDDVVDLGFRLERALLLGLAARVNTRLQPFPAVAPTLARLRGAPPRARIARGNQWVGSASRYAACCV